MRAPAVSGLSVVFAAVRLFSQQSDPPPPGELIDIGARKLHVQCQGSGSPAVVVESGGGSFSVEWGLVRALVAKRNRICTYDRAGYAWSDRGPVDEDAAQVADDLHQLISRLVNPWGVSLEGRFNDAFPSRLRAWSSSTVPPCSRSHWY
jgi:hypothetical protein